jgi:phosphoglycolate phosphatase-like HAD superfamily hydrolase
VEATTRSVRSGIEPSGGVIATLWTDRSGDPRVSYEAVVFDNDGVLTRPTPSGVLREGVRAAFRSLDVDPDDEAVEAGAYGDEATVRDACDRYGLDPETFWRRRELHVARAQRDAILAGEKPLYDDVGILGRLVDADVRTGIVSNNQHETVEQIADLFDLHGRFETVYGREPSFDGFRRRKPDPHYIRRALDDLGVDPAATPVLYVGDSTVDVRAAARVGADAAFVRRPHREGYEVGADPTYEVEGLDEVVALALDGVRAR